MQWLAISLGVLPAFTLLASVAWGQPDAGGCGSGFDAIPNCDRKSCGGACEADNFCSTGFCGTCCTKCECGATACSCLETTIGCNFVATLCADSNECTSDSCSESQNTCVFKPLHDGASCSNSCFDANSCTTDACVCQGGQPTCLHDPIRDGTACSNGQFCDGILEDTCLVGVCIGMGTPCDDNDPGTTDFCNEFNDVCFHEQDLDFFTDFEDINTIIGEIIVLGVSPTTADLGGDAFAGTVGEPELSFSGLQSWMVLPNGTGTITFETDAADVQFWVTTHPLASPEMGRTVIRAFDAFDVLVEQVVIPSGSGFHFVSFSEIARIIVINTDDVEMSGIDDFAFTALPEPSATLMLLSGGALLAVLGRRRYAP